MVKRGWLCGTLGCLLLAGWSTAAQAGEHRLGLGMHYWQTLDQIGNDVSHGHGHIDDSGLSTVFSYQYLPSGFLKLECDVEYFAQGFGGSTSSAFSPQFYLLVGHGIYGGVGIGVTAGSGFDNQVSDPFYAAKVGWEIGLFPRLDLVLEGNYRVGAWKQLEDQGVDTDTVTLGAAVRVTL